MLAKDLLLTWTLLLLRGCNLSVVIDSLSQKGIVISEYCPKMAFCEEGAHVMCMYYDPTRVMGPRCTNPRNVSMTSELAVKLLEVSNAIRGKLAMGLEKGKGGVDLPRAYGMFKLHWDNELATFAQVLANQCVLRHDMCRATKKFSDPGQTAGLIRFSSPDWIPVSKSKGGHFTQPGLMPSKITYAITQALKTWYAQKSYVTPAMIIDYPDWNLVPTKQNGRPYLEMVSGPATHMGCGISAYAEYAYYEAKSPLNYNSMQVICNFSTRPKKHKTVFDLEPGPHTSRCGCPPNAIEDDNCLCTYLEEKIEPKEALNCDGVNCEQPVILLPIFTIEDAPPSKLIGRQGPNFFRAPSSLEFLDNAFPTNHSRSEHSSVNVLNDLVEDNIVHETPQGSIRSVLGKSPNYMKSHIPSTSHQQHRKTSIFSRSDLLGSSKANIPLKLTFKDFKKDVVARKDFSRAKYLLNNYMESIKNFSDLQYRPHLSDDKDIKSKKYSSIIDTVHNVEGIVLPEHNNDTFHAKYNEIEHEGDRDTKLMTLLDKLEEEVQHIELTGNKKELFDAKIRKIYDSVVGKSSSLTTPKSKHISESTNIGPGKKDKFIDIDHEHEHEQERKHEHEHEQDHDLDHNHESDHEHDFDNKYKIELQEHKDAKLDKTAITKIIDDIVHTNLNDNVDLPNNIDENDDIVKKRHMRIKTRQNSGFSSNRDSDSDFDFREKPKTSSQTDKFLGVYRSSDNEYKPYRFNEYRKSYKSKIPSYSFENFKMNRFNIDEPRNAKRFKHRDYYKNRDASYTDNFNENHYRRHPTRNNERNIDDDVLSPERRKFYQERLENLERQLQNTRTRKFRNKDDRHRRPMRIPGFDDEAPRRPSKSRLDHFDMRERSRFIHGF